MRRSVKEKLLEVLLTIEKHKALQSLSDSESAVVRCVKQDGHTQTQMASSQGLQQSYNDPSKPYVLAVCSEVRTVEFLRRDGVIFSLVL